MTRLENEVDKNIKDIKWMKKSMRKLGAEYLFNFRVHQQKQQYGLLMEHFGYGILDYEVDVYNCAYEKTVQDLWHLGRLGKGSKYMRG